MNYAKILILILVLLVIASASIAYLLFSHEKYAKSTATQVEQFINRSITIVPSKTYA